MSRLEVSAAVRHIYVSLGFKRLSTHTSSTHNYSKAGGNASALSLCTVRCVHTDS